MNWLYLVFFANLISAVVVLLDRHLVSDRAYGKSEVYAFYVGVLSIFVIALLPFHVVLKPSFHVILLSIITALSYMVSIIYLYKALRVSDASDVAPMLGAVVALSAYVFNLAFLHETYNGNFLPAFTFLVIGMVLMSYFRFTKKSFFFVIISGALLGFSFIFMKILFTLTTFPDAFFWSRMANVLAALLLLLIPINRNAILRSFYKTRPRTVYLTFINKAMSGVAVLMIFYAINIGHVSLVNALNGLQFVFLFIFALIFSKKFPKYFDETILSNHNAFFKVMATFFIVVGYFLLFA